MARLKNAISTGNGLESRLPDLNIINKPGKRWETQGEHHGSEFLGGTGKCGIIPP
jgi:hypothetical protein